MVHAAESWHTGRLLDVEFRIDELPVVDADNKPLGMIDVQDIVTIKVMG